MKFNTPLKSEYTGRYNCTARYPNNLIETISWYVYFYPANGTLFLKCPLYGQISICLVFYRNNIPFRIPCRALHPKIKTTQQTDVIYIKIIFNSIY